MFNQGALAIGKICLYAPINLSALNRTRELKPWILTWAPANAFFLTPSQWFVESHNIRWSGDGSPRKLSYSRAFYIWAPPPCIADVAIEQLREARLKRHNSIHVMIIPKLFFSLWRRQFYKAMDMVLFLPPRWKHWPSNMHEPLIFGFSFPFVRFKP